MAPEASVQPFLQEIELLKQKVAKYEQEEAESGKLTKWLVEVMKVAKVVDLDQLAEVISVGIGKRYEDEEAAAVAAAAAAKGTGGGGSGGKKAGSKAASNSASAAAGAGAGASSSSAAAKGKHEEADVDELKSELKYYKDLWFKLNTLYDSLKREVNGAKEHLLVLAERLPDVLPTHVFCEATEDLVIQALEKDKPEKMLRKGKKERTKLINEAVQELDTLLRDTSFDPWIRKNGKIEGCDKQNKELKRIREKYGSKTTKLVTAKSYEIDQHNPSGHYPIKHLAQRGRDAKGVENWIPLSLPEAIERLSNAVSDLLSPNNKK